MIIPSKDDKKRCLGIKDQYNSACLSLRKDRQAELYLHLQTELYHFTILFLDLPIMSWGGGAVLDRLDVKLDPLVMTWNLYWQIPDMGQSTTTNIKTYWNLYFET